MSEETLAVLEILADEYLQTGLCPRCRTDNIEEKKPITECNLCSLEIPYEVIENLLDATPFLECAYCGDTMPFYRFTFCEKCALTELPF